MGSCVANQCAENLLRVVPRFVASMSSKISPDLRGGGELQLARPCGGLSGSRGVWGSATIHHAHGTEGGCPPSWRPGVLALGCGSRLNGQIFVGAIHMQLKIRLRTCGWRLCPPNLFVPCHKAFVAPPPYPWGRGRG